LGCFFSTCLIKAGKSRNHCRERRGSIIAPDLEE